MSLRKEFKYTLGFRELIQAQAGTAVVEEFDRLIARLRLFSRETDAEPGLETHDDQPDVPGDDGAPPTGGGGGGGDDTNDDGDPFLPTPLPANLFWWEVIDTRDHTGSDLAIKDYEFLDAPASADEGGIVLIYNKGAKPVLLVHVDPFLAPATVHPVRSNRMFFPRGQNYLLQPRECLPMVLDRESPYGLWRPLMWHEGETRRPWKHGYRAFMGDTTLRGEYGQNPGTTVTPTANLHGPFGSHTISYTQVFSAGYCDILEDPWFEWYIRTGSDMAGLYLWLILTANTPGGTPNGATATPPNHTVGWRYSTADDSVWTAICADGSSFTTYAVPGRTVDASTYYRLRCRVRNQQAFFSVNNSPEVAITANLPANGNNLNARVYFQNNGGTGTQTLEIGRFEVNFGY